MAASGDGGGDAFDRVVRRTAMAHCARPAGSCAKCEAMRGEKWAVLRLFRSNKRGEARPTVRVALPGSEPAWREYAVERTFASREEAHAYFEAHRSEIAAWVED
jgi:hypothetical protein